MGTSRPHQSCCITRNSRLEMLFLGCLGKVYKPTFPIIMIYKNIMTAVNVVTPQREYHLHL